MKNKRIYISVLLLMLLMVEAACTKYSEGPMLSLRTKTERVANNWKIAQALEDGEDVTPAYNRFELDLSKSGGAKLSADYTFFGTTFEFTTQGSWVFVSNKEKLSLDFENDAADGVYRILKLKEKEMWLKKEGSSLELHLVPR